MNPPERSARGIYTREYFLSIYLPAITLALGTGMVVPVIPVYARSFGVSFEVASLVIILQQLGHTFAALPIGLLIDRIGRRKIVLAGPVLLALSSFLIVTAQSFNELLIYRFIAGIGEQMWLLGRLTMIADTGADNERGRQIATLHAMESGGRLLSPAIGGFLASFLDIRAPFIVHGILCLIAIVPSFKLVVETAPNLTRRGPGRAAGGTAEPDAGWAPLLAYTVVIFLVAQLFGSLSRGPIFSGQLNLYGAYVYDMDPKAIGVLATVVTGMSIPIGLASGYVMDRFGRKATLVPGFCLLVTALAFVSFTAHAQAPFPWFVAAYLCVYATNSTTSGTMQTLGSDLAPQNARGRFYGVSQTLGSVGGPISTSAFAVLSGTMGYWVAFAFLGVMAGGAALILGTQVRYKISERAVPATTAASP